MPGRTLYAMFLETVARYGDNRAVGFKRGKDAAHTYWTYREFNDHVRAFARGLDALGLRKGDRIAIIAHENRVEWPIADLAAQYLGLVTVAIYGTLPAAQVAYYVQDSGARLLLIADEKQQRKVREFRESIPTLEIVVSMDGTPEELAPDCILAFDEVTRKGEAGGRDFAALDAVSATVHPEDTATLIYTSGTTGDPKGAMLSHLALSQTADGVVAEPVAVVYSTDVYLSFLPLSHVTERAGGYYLPLRTGGCIVFSQGLSQFKEELTETVRPTVLFCVPRLYEDIAGKARDGLKKLPDRQRKIATWAIQVGETCARLKSEGKSPGLVLSLQRALAERLVLEKLRQRVTGGRLRIAVSGGAPLDPQAVLFFLGVGLTLLEGYGLSETSVMAVNRPGRERIGTVGPLMPETEVKIADDGEILMRGRGRLLGYWNLPDATKEAIDGEGWFHTGDIGELSPDGYLKITDRKKDILVLANGKKVAPQPIEALLKHSPYIGEAVLLGDRQATVSALLVPAFDKLLEWGKAQGKDTKDLPALLASPEAQKLYKAEVEANTPGLADFEKIKKFRLLDKPFSIDGGELTPTLKVKRKTVAQKYADQIATMQRGGDK